MNTRSLIRLAVAITFVLTALNLLAAPGARATSFIRVTTTGKTAGSCGSDWTTDTCSLQTALTNAVSGDDLWVAAGTYKPTSDTNRSITFQLKNGVAIYGGFAMTETLRSERDPATNVVTLSGDIGTVGNNGDNSYHVVMGANDAILDGVTISGGNANGGYSYDNGGGMYNNASSPTLHNVIFSSNSARYGGGMYNTSSSPTLDNVTFSSNSASQKGGGLYNSNSSRPTLTTVTFSGNSAIWNGGGMHNSSFSRPTLTTVTFSGNSADSGGGMSNSTSSSPTLTNVTFSGNSASTNGGGMDNDSSSPTLTNVTFSGNSAIWNGGGMFNISSSPTLTNVTFSGNSASKNGGGGMGNNMSSNATLNNVTFAGNTAIYGGGINNTSSSPLLNNVTFSSNSASYGGGIYNISYNPTSRPNIRNSIFWGDAGGEMYNYASAPTVSDSVVQGGCPAGITCKNIISANPLLGALANYGGSTRTLPLLPGSSAIDAGNSATCPATDQRGVARPAGARCDVGAFESQGFTLGSLTGNNQIAAINAAFATPLGLIVAANNALDPVSGGQVKFTPPGTGASATLSGSPAAIGADGRISVSATANATRGTYTVTVSTSGAASVGFSLTNFKGDTTTSLTSSDNPAPYGQSVTFTATVIPAAATGTVTFKDGGVTIPGCEAQPLTEGQAACTTAALSRGARVIVAEYSGNALYYGSISNNYSQMVNKSAATITLGDLNQTYDGHPRPVSVETAPVSLTVVITYTGTGGMVYGPSLTAPTNAGTYQVDAAIVETNYYGAASAALTIAKVNTALALASLPNPAAYGETILVTATVIPATASGTVTFKNGGVAVTGCEAQPVTGGQATCTISDLAVGKHLLTAEYNGEANHNGGTSGSLSQTVNQATPTLTLASSPNPAGRYQTVTFTATLSAPTASGTVAFKDGSTTIAGCEAQDVSGGVATCATVALALGTRTITAEYSGDGNYNAVVSGPLYQIVQRTATTTTLTSSLNPANLNQTVTFTATVTPTPSTGAVAFKDNGVTIPGCAAQAVSSGQATCTTAALNVGAHFITAEYSGSDDSTFSIGLLTPDQVVNCISAIAVTSDADNGTGSLRTAIANVCADGTITFSGNYTILLSSTLTIDKNVTVDGSGHTVTVSGNRGDVGEDEASNIGVRVFSVGDGDGVGDASIVLNLKHLTVAKGYSRNTEGGGGGLWVVDSTANLSDVTFFDNLAAVGGGLNNIRGTVHLTNTTFISNTANAGGGLFNQSSGTTLSNVTFISNTAGLYGGGMYNSGGSPTLSHVTFVSNTATTGGGGMYNSPGNPVLTDVAFRGNSAGEYGGGIHNWDGSPVLMNVAIIGNSALAGGGMYNDLGDPILINVTFSGNSAGEGGGMSNVYNSHPTLNNVTFSGNTADVSGGGLYNMSYEPSTIQVQNSLLWGNTAPDGAQIFNGDGVAAGVLTVTVAHSVVQGGYLSGTDILTDNPLLGSLGNYGGDPSTSSGQTIPLLPGSPAIDAADPAYCSLGHDQRGMSHTGACDIGAFESQGFTLGSLTGDGQSAVINTAFAVPLGLTVTPNNPLEPVTGGQVTFTPYGSDATAAVSGSPATIGLGATAAVTATANSIGGTYTVTVGAAGVVTDVNFSLTNLKADATVTLTSSPNPSTYGQSVTFTATVSPAEASGMVTFKDGAAAITGCEAQALTAGQATCATTVLTAGLHTIITAVYDGDASYNGSVSGNYSQTVNKAPAAITLGDLEQTYDGAPKPVNAATSPLGLTVVITYTSAGYGPALTAPTEVGAYQVDAAIVDVDYQGWVSATLTITKADTLITLVSSSNPSDVAQTVIFTATVSPAAASGTVTFKDDGTVIPGCATQTLTGGQAACATNALTLDAHAITAEYSGDEHYHASIGDLNQQVGCRSYIPVMNEADAGADSLRQAMADLCSGGEITFGGDYTIHLTSTLAITKNMTVDGAWHTITLSGDTDNDGDGDVRVFSVNAGVTFNLNHLTVTKGNAGGDSGGGLYANGGTVNLTDVTFNGNLANTGGGLYYENGHSTLTNVVFSGNYATLRGGGLQIADGSTITLTNVTLSGNQAAQGGGLVVMTGTLTATNTILWGNLPAGVDQLSLTAGVSVISFTHSLLPGVCLVGISCTNTLNANPQFIRQPQPGADGLWGTSDDDYGDLHLDFASPAIDAGTDCTDTDLDGLPRPNDGDGDGVATCDMGAYEAGEMVGGVSEGSTYTFTNQSNIRIEVGALGSSSLAYLYVDEMETSYLSATVGLQNGRYWRIRGLTNDRTPATGFSVTLTLSVPFIPDENDKICRYTGSGEVWDCAQTGFDADARIIWRSGITAFSDWAVGNDVGPTNIALRVLSARSQSGPPDVAAIGLLGALGAAIIAWRRRK